MSSHRALSQLFPRFIPQDFFWVFSRHSFRDFFIETTQEHQVFIPTGFLENYFWILFEFSLLESSPKIALKIFLWFNHAFLQHSVNETFTNSIWNSVRNFFRDLFSGDPGIPPGICSRDNSRDSYSGCFGECIRGSSRILPGFLPSYLHWFLLGFLIGLF